MPSLQSAARAGESHFQTDDGMDFLGTLFSVTEGTVPSYDLSNPRTFLRVMPESFIDVGIIMIDAYGRRFLTANHDLSSLSDIKLYKVFRVFLLNRLAVWERNATQNDALTGLPMKNGSPQDLGSIWISEEMIQREEIDLTFRIKEQSRKIITNAALQLNDRLDNMTVKRIESVLGVTYAEIQ